MDSHLMLVSIRWSLEVVGNFQEGDEGVEHILGIPTSVQDQKTTRDKVAWCTSKNWVGLA